MRVSTLLDYLVNSELASLAINDLTKPTNVAKILSYLNRALAEVNKEFLLNQAELIIDLAPNQTRYYIADEQLIKIIEAYNSLGTELYLNADTDPKNTVFIPEHNIIDYYGVNNATATITDFITVIYLKGFVTITTVNDTIRINEAMTECITSYVGYLAHSALPKNSGNTVNMYFQKYLASVAKTKELNIVPDWIYGSIKLDARGFV
jgi:hypothetical protein